MCSFSLKRQHHLTSAHVNARHDYFSLLARARWGAKASQGRCEPGGGHISAGSGQPVLANMDTSKRLLGNGWKDNDHTARSFRRHGFNNTHVGGQREICGHQPELLFPSQPLPQSHVAALASPWLTREKTTPKSRAEEDTDSCSVTKPLDLLPVSKNTSHGPIF